MIFCDASGLEVSAKKPSIVCSCENIKLKYFISSLFLYKISGLEESFKYLGFHLKPNGYRTKDREWLVKRIQWKMNNWTFCWLSLGGRLTLVTFVLQGIFVYWFSVYWCWPLLYLRLDPRCFILCGLENWSFQSYIYLRGRVCLCHVVLEDGG